MVSQCIDAPVSRENFIEKVGTIVEAIQAVEILDLIDQLREGQANWVTIYQNNDEPPPNAGIEVGGDWTHCDNRSFYGSTLLDCLKQATELRSQFENRNSKMSS